jgi:beta-glucanase (GH16 family)
VINSRSLRFFAASLVLAALQYPLTVLADPPSDKAWEPIPELTDEFNDSFNWDKWLSWNPAWLGRQPGLFAPWNVAVADGELQLTAKLEDIPYYHSLGYHTYTTAAVKSRKRVKYGYFEIRAKPMDSSASSAFWLYDKTSTAQTEIDVFEISGHSSVYPVWNDYVAYFNARVYKLEGSGATEQRPIVNGNFWWAPHRLADEYHVYGLEWDEKQIKWYVDGVVMATVDNRYWNLPIYMNFDAETFYSLGLPEASDLPSVYHIDYVRSWARQGTAQSSIYPGY